jgi:hypothetical protein
MTLSKNEHKVWLGWSVRILNRFCRRFVRMRAGVTGGSNGLKQHNKNAEQGVHGVHFPGASFQNSIKAKIGGVHITK